MNSGPGVRDPKNDLEKKSMPWHLRLSRAEKESKGKFRSKEGMLAVSH